MPGMATMPTIQSIPPANNSARPVDGSMAPANIPDAPDAALVAGNPAKAQVAQSSSSDTTSGAQAGSAPDSFADVLRRQMAQTGATDAPVADSPLVPGLTLPIQIASGAVTASPSAPITVESLLSDLSEFTDRRDLGSATTPVPGGVTVAEDIRSVPGANTSFEVPPNLIDAAKILPMDSKVSATATASATLDRYLDGPGQSGDDLKSLPVAAGNSDLFHSAPLADMARAIAVHSTDPASQPSDPASEEATQEEMAPANLSFLAPLIQSLQPNEIIGPAAEVAVDVGQPAVADTSGLLPAAMLPTTVATRSTMDMAAAPTTTSEVPLEAAGKSAEIAARQDILAAVPAADSGGSERPETIEPERSFDASLAAATQTFSQHRNTGVHAANSSSAALPIHTPVGKHGWDGEVSDKLVWMVGRREQRAELVLNPPQMGRIEVSLSMNDGQTSALFVSANPAVRDALEAALPRLREILADAGVNLGQTQVGADTGNGAGNSSTNNAENRDNPGRGLSTQQLPPGNEVLRQLDAPQWLKRGNGLVDVFA